MILRHTNGDIETDGATPHQKGAVEGTDGATPRQKDAVEETDNEFDSTGNVRPYKTPVRLQKKKTLAVMPAPVIASSKSEGEESKSESEVELVEHKLKKKKNKGRQVPDGATESVVRDC